MKALIFNRRSAKLLLFLLFLGCQFTGSEEDNQQVNIVYIVDSIAIEESNQISLPDTTFPFDTIFPLEYNEFDAFWSQFTEHLKVDNREAVIEYLYKYIPVGDISDYRGCLRRKKGDRTPIFKWGPDSLDVTGTINRRSVHKYYDFIFWDFFKKMIIATTTEDLLKHGNHRQKQQALSYMFVPEYYGFDGCGGDTVLGFLLYRKNGNWIIDIRSFYNYRTSWD